VRRLIVHGGAGRIPPEREAQAEAGARGALKAGWKAFGSATDAVEAAVAWMEDTGTFNAGRGAVLDLRGKVELDAGLMTSDHRVGGVAGLTRTPFAIRVARRVMEETPHALLMARGADRFAAAMGFRAERLGTPARRALYRELRGKLENGRYSKGPWHDSDPSRDMTWWQPLVRLVREHPELLHGTVGAVALDDGGRITAATSTGGILLKMEGRVSDTCLFGCGTYADERIGLSATGIGEVIIRHSITRAIAERLAAERTTPSEAISRVLTPLPSDTVGVIAVDRRGRFGLGRNTTHLAFAHRTERPGSERSGTR
jgi:L-asparaginase / beta-aspartyl-peptidase